MKSLELLQRQQLSITQQFGASAFHTVVRWHKLHEADNEYTLHTSIILATCVPKIIKFGTDLRSSDKNKFGHFLAHPVGPVLQQHALIWLS